MLAGRIDEPLTPKTYEYGQLFENFVVCQINRLLTYDERQFKLSFLRVSETQEIYLIVERGNKTFLCEIKSSEKADPRMTKSLQILSDQWASITPIPGTDSYVRGVVNLRGKIIPAVDLRVKFGIDPKKDDPETCIVVMTNPSQNSLIGFVVDTVIDVTSFRSSEIQNAPDRLISDDILCCLSWI